MRRCSLLLAVLLYPTPSPAEVIEDPKEIVRAVSAGRAGAWFDEHAVRKCLAADIEAESLRGEVVELQEQNSSYARSITVYKQVEQDQLALVAAWTAKYNAEHQLRLSLEGELGAWYRSPWVLPPVSLVVGGALGFALGVDR